MNKAKKSTPAKDPAKPAPKNSKPDKAGSSANSDPKAQYEDKDES